MGQLIGDPPLYLGWTQEHCLLVAVQMRMKQNLDPKYQMLKKTKNSPMGNEDMTFNQLCSYLGIVLIYTKE